MIFIFSFTLISITNQCGCGANCNHDCCDEKIEISTKMGPDCPHHKKVKKDSITTVVFNKLFKVCCAKEYLTGKTKINDYTIAQAQELETLNLTSKIIRFDYISSLKTIYLLPDTPPPKLS